MNIKTIIFLDSTADLNKINEDLKKKSIIIIRESNDISEKNVISLQEFDKTIKETKNFYGLHWLQKWANKKIIEKKSLKELMVYDNQTLWYFIEYLLFSDTWALENFTPTSRVLYYIDSINYFLEKFKPSLVYVKNDKDEFYKIVKDICKKNKITINNLLIHHKKKSSKLKTNVFLIRQYLKSRLKLRKILGLITKKKQPSKILILSSDRFSFGEKKKNVFWGTILNELDKKGINNKIIEYDRLWNIKMLKKIISNILSNHPDCQYIGNYYNKQVFSDIKKISKFIKKEWDKIKKEKNFQESLNYEGINIYEYVKKRFKLVFEALNYFVADVIAISKEVIEKERPKLILIDHEDNFYGKGFIVNSKNTLTKVIALQHELVNPMTCIHRHIKDKNVLDKNSALWRPLPNYKCASGAYAKKILLEYCNYPENKIVITGQPRYDDLINLKENNKEKIYKEFGLHPNKKIIVYASKFLPSENNIFNILSEYANKNDIQLIFKAHPNARLNILKEHIKESKNVRLLHEINLFKLLNITDLLITVSSTVAIEAMYLDKPVLVIDLFKRCTLPFVESGAAYGVNDEQKIIEGLEKTLYDKDIKNKLKKGRDVFLSEYMYKIDGKSTERVVELIKNV